MVYYVMEYYLALKKRKKKNYTHCIINESNQNNDELKEARHKKIHII